MLRREVGRGCVPFTWLDGRIRPFSFAPCDATARAAVARVVLFPHDSTDGTALRLRFELRGEALTGCLCDAFRGSVPARGELALPTATACRRSRAGGSSTPSPLPLATQQCTPTLLHCARRLLQNSSSLLRWRAATIACRPRPARCRPKLQQGGLTGTSRRRRIFRWSQATQQGSSTLLQICERCGVVARHCCDV